MSVHIKKRERIIKNGRNRKPRPKTFATADAAHAYAKSQGYKEYALKNLRTDAQPKIRIEVA